MWVRAAPRSDQSHSTKLSTVLIYVAASCRRPQGRRGKTVWPLSGVMQVKYVFVLRSAGLKKTETTLRRLPNAGAKLEVSFYR